MAAPFCPVAAASLWQASSKRIDASTLLLGISLQTFVTPVMAAPFCRLAAAGLGQGIQQDKPCRHHVVQQRRRRSPLRRAGD